MKIMHDIVPSTDSRGTSALVDLAPKRIPLMVTVIMLSLKSFSEGSSFPRIPMGSVVIRSLCHTLCSTDVKVVRSCFWSMALCSCCVNSSPVERPALNKQINCMIPISAIVDFSAKMSQRLFQLCCLK